MSEMSQKALAALVTKTGRSEKQVVGGFLVAGMFFVFLGLVLPWFEYKAEATNQAGQVLVNFEVLEKTLTDGFSDVAANLLISALLFSGVSLICLIRYQAPDGEQTSTQNVIKYGCLMSGIATLMVFFGVIAGLFNSFCSDKDELMEQAITDAEQLSGQDLTNNRDCSQFLAGGILTLIFGMPSLGVACFLMIGLAASFAGASTSPVLPVSAASAARGPRQGPETNSRRPGPPPQFQQGSRQPRQHGSSTSSMSNSSTRGPPRQHGSSRSGPPNQHRPSGPGH